MNDSMNGLEHLGDLKAALREALQPLAEALDRSPLTFDHHSTDHVADGTLQTLFDGSDGRTYCFTIRPDGLPTLAVAD